MSRSGSLDAAWPISARLVTVVTALRAAGPTRAPPLPCRSSMDRQVESVLPGSFRGGLKPLAQRRKQLRSNRTDDCVRTRCRIASAPARLRADFPKGSDANAVSTALVTRGFPLIEPCGDDPRTARRPRATWRRQRAVPGLRHRCLEVRRQRAFARDRGIRRVSGPVTGRGRSSPRGYPGKPKGALEGRARRRGPSLGCSAERMTSRKPPRIRGRMSPRRNPAGRSPGNPRGPIPGAGRRRARRRRPPG